ncbi:MAG: TldD/PmbA family protein [Sphingomonadaceae bacterium]|nr:TldD/PmbA family protein [Sphingomonadaceae bacterium]
MDDATSPNALPSDAWLIDRAHAAVKAARAVGAEAAEAVVRAGHSTSVSVRLGELEDVDSAADVGLSLRLFVGQRAASISVTDLADHVLADAAARAMAMARHAPDDPWAGLLDPQYLGGGSPMELDLVDPASPPDAAMLRAAATRAEGAARAVAGVSNSDGGHAVFSIAAEAHVTSHGFADAARSTSHSISASVIAGSGDTMQRDYDWTSARHHVDILSPEEIGTRAGQRTVARLHPQMPDGGAMPIVFDPRVGASLIGHLLGAMSGPAIARDRSFLIGHEGAAIFPAAISIIDDPHVVRGQRSYIFDGEGMASAPSRIVDHGVIGPWRCDMASARQLGRAPSGHGGSGGGTTSGNITLLPGDQSFAALIADIDRGILVTELVGQGVDPITGDYSRGASGFAIVGGEVAHPVSGFTIAGNLLEIFASLTAANDLCTHYATHVPSLRSDALFVAGGMSDDG